MLDNIDELMKKMRHVNENLAQELFFLIDNGTSKAKISRETKVNVGTILRILRMPTCNPNALTRSRLVAYIMEQGNRHWSDSLGWSGRKLR